MTEMDKADDLAEALEQGGLWAVKRRESKDHEGYVEKTATESVEPVRLLLIEEIVDAATTSAVKN